MRNITVLFVSSLMMVTGCTTTGHTPLDKDIEIVSVSINQEVSLPDEVYYLGPGFGIAALFGAVGGAIGGAISAPNNMSESHAIGSFAENNRIYISEIVLSSFTEELNQSGKFSINSDSAITINLTIKKYGLSIPHGFSSELVPILLFEAEMVDKSGEILWNAEHNVLSLGNPADPVKLEEIKKDPHTLRMIWTLAAERAAKETIGEIER